MRTTSRGRESISGSPVTTGARAMLAVATAKVSAWGKRIARLDAGAPPPGRRSDLSRRQPASRAIGFVDGRRQTQRAVGERLYLQPRTGSPPTQSKQLQGQGRSLDPGAALTMKLRTPERPAPSSRNRWRSSLRFSSPAGSDAQGVQLGRSLRSPLATVFAWLIVWASIAAHCGGTLCLRFSFATAWPASPNSVRAR